MTPAAAPPIRVLHVVFSLDAGGMENGIVNVTRALEGRGFEIHICCLARGGRFVERLPLPDRVCALGKQEGFSPGLIRSLSRHIQSLSPHVIHTHNFGPLIYTALAAPGARRRTLHGEHAALTPGELAPHRRLLRRFLYRRVRQVHTVSTALRESLIAHGFAARRITIITNGVDADRFSPGSRQQAREQTALPRDATILGLFGRFGAFKRHIPLIEAFERLPAGAQPAHLLFVGGGGPMEAAVRERAAASPCAQRIHMAGFQADTLPWYRSLDLLVIPSTNEGLSNALLEAMACGVPVLGHHVCGNADVIADSQNGLLRDLGSPEALHTALAAILARPEALPPLGDSARRTARQDFSLAAMAAGYAAQYRRIAATADVAATG